LQKREYKILKNFIKYSKIGENKVLLLKQALSLDAILESMQTQNQTKTFIQNMFSIFFQKKRQE
jgi:hypothetical protein